MKIKSPKKTGNVEGDAESRKKEERGETKKGMNKLVVVVVVGRGHKTNNKCEPWKENRGYMK